jgi:peptidoglycan/LPS O-acetylase OafA/YrhL
MLTAVLIGAAVLEPGKLREVPRVLPSILTGTYNYQIACGGPHFDVLVVIWSLCVEAQFYLLWPWVLRRLHSKRSLRLCAGAIAAFSAYRACLYAFLNWGHLGHPGSISTTWIYFATDTRLDVILIGCAAALSLKDRSIVPVWRMRQRRIFSWIALAAACACVRFVTGGARPRRRGEAQPSVTPWRARPRPYW